MCVWMAILDNYCPIRSVFSFKQGDVCVYLPRLTKPLTLSHIAVMVAAPLQLFTLLPNVSILALNGQDGVNVL